MPQGVFVNKCNWWFDLGEHYTARYTPMLSWGCQLDFAGVQK
jgi:hypothetical protein